MHRFINHVRRLPIGFTGALATCALTIGTMSVGQSAVIADPATLAARVPHVAVRDLGLASRTTAIRIGVALNYRNSDALEAFIRATSDPSSPEYGQFLTPKGFAANFAPAVADYERVAATLHAAGFTLLPSPTGSIVEASAPAAVVERFFGTSIHNVTQNGVSGTRYANAAPAYIPSALRGVTFGVAGLNNLVIAKTHNVRGARRIDAALSSPLQGPDTGLGPLAYATAYDYPVQHARPGAGGATFDGTGRSIGIAIDSDFLDSDLAAFLSYFKIKRTAPLARVKVDGGPAGTGGINSDNVETNLDVETIASLAPGAGVYMYLMPQLSTLDIVDTYSKVVADDKVDVLDSSFGGCEYADNLGTLSDHIAQQGAAEGITFSASTGDFGAQGCYFFDQSFLGVSAPASDPHFTAVGGTSLLIDTAGKYRAEFTWIGGGGGLSTIFPQPLYQKGIPHMSGPTRNLPDIAMDANPGTGAAFYYNGAFSGPIGGTSLSSPLFCALLAEFDEVSGKRAGLVNTALYSAFKKTGYGVHFRDITIGNNEFFFRAGYSAGAGYDNVTGIGSPIGSSNAK